MLSEILSANAGLKQVIDEYGNLSLNQYFQKLFTLGRSSISEFALEALGNLCQEHISTCARSAIVEKYAKTSVIDTAIHGGLITEPQSFQAASLQAYASKGDEVLVILGCTAVRLNTQTFPRGVLYKGKRYPLFKNDDEQKLTYSCPPLTRDLVSRFAKRTADAGVPSEWLLSVIESTPELFSPRYTRFVEQATLLDKRVLMEAYSGMPKMPKVLILPLEDLSKELLLESFNKKDIFYKMIFDENMRTDALNTFDDIQGAWKGSVGGNHFFVGANQKGDQTALIVKDGKLVGRDRDFELEISESAITDALKTRKIAPGVFLSLQLLVMHGITPTGGYFQIQYLPKMMSKMDEYLKRHCCDCSWTTKVKGNLLSYGFLFALEGEHPLSIETAVSRPDKFAEVLAENAEKLTVRQALELNLPALYREIVK